MRIIETNRDPDRGSRPAYAPAARVAPAFLAAFLALGLTPSPARAEPVAPPALRVKAGDLQNTEVVSTLDTWMLEGRNVIWSAAFQLAWNELCTFSEEDLRMTPEDPSVTLLNRKAARKGQLDEAVSFLGVGQADGEGLDKMAASLAARFPGQPFSGLAEAGKTLPAGSVYAYGYLFADLPFERAFSRFEAPFDFNGTTVEAFGLAADRADPEKPLAADQVLVYRSDERPGVVVELKTRLAGHRLYLAKIPPLATLGETARDVFKRAKEIPPQGLPAGAGLAVPRMDFDLIREFAELTGRPLRTRKFEGQSVGMATQQVRFRLDGRDAAHADGDRVAGPGSNPGFAFNEPFLVLLQYGDSRMPCFAAWIDNAELLIPRP